MPIAANETLVILTGGTPEAVVAGIAVGFKTIIYVASDDNEELIQKMNTSTPTFPDLIGVAWTQKTMLLGCRDLAGKSMAAILCFSLRLAHAVQIAMRRR